MDPELRDLEIAQTKAAQLAIVRRDGNLGLLVLPPGPRAGRVPLLGYCHGGPRGGLTWELFPQFAHLVGQVEPYPVQALASAGFAILMPMPRGGSGYGEEAYSLIDNALGEPTIATLWRVSTTRLRRALPVRIGSASWARSYGGFMTNWIVTQTDRFRRPRRPRASTIWRLCTISPRPASSSSNTSRRRGRTPPRTRCTRDVVRGECEDTAAHSARRANPRVPIEQPRQFYRALKAHGKTVEFDIYPRGGHVLREHGAQREQMRRNMEYGSRAGCDLPGQCLELEERHESVV